MMESGHCFEDLVSIIIPTYNSEKTVEKTILTALNQSYSNIEIIVIDDFSNDSTRDIILSYAKQSEKIRYYFKKENKGVADSRNIGIRLSQGKYVAFLDSDDLWCKDKLKKQIEFMKSKKLTFSYTNYYTYNASNQIVVAVKGPQKINYNQLLRGNMIGCLTVVFDKSEIGAVSIPLIKKRNDYSLWLEILSQGHEAYLLDEFLAIKVDYEDSLSSGSKLSLLKYHYDMFRKHRFMGIVTSAYYTFLNSINFVLKKIKYEKKESDKQLEQLCE